MSCTTLTLLSVKHLKLAVNKIQVSYILFIYKCSNSEDINICKQSFIIRLYKETYEY